MANGFRDFKNSRKYVRANIHALTRYKCPTYEKAVEIQTRISDISEGGVCLITFLDPLPPNTLIAMSFALPGDLGGIVTVGGRVKATKILDKDCYRSGVEFLGMAQKTLLAIREYVASHQLKKEK